MIVTTALLVAAPLQQAVRHDWTGWMILLLLPQTLPLTLPGVLLVGVLTGTRHRPIASATRRAVLGIALAGSLASFATIAWLIPASNEAFRVAVAGHHVSKGVEEMPFLSLRDAALAARHDAVPVRAGRLFVAYHVRWALVGAALSFALFGLGVAALRTGAAVSAGTGVIAYAVYTQYLFELGSVPPVIFNDEPLTILVVWLPNLLLVLVGLAFLKTADIDRAAAPPLDGWQPG
jgi:lipopolysaccharide export LptBFGC system permease protein LptF